MDAIETCGLAIAIPSLSLLTSPIFSFGVLKIRLERVGIGDRKAYRNL